MLWSAGRTDAWPLLLIGLLPVLVALPQLFGLLHSDPMFYIGALTTKHVAGPLPGVPYIDPNNGLTTQALGYRAALDWIHGEVPWWNPYSGIGLPLAAEYQPAAFFPLTLLLLLPQGDMWRHLLLQMLAGWGTYGLLRQLGLKRTGAVTGGILYAFNGTLAWFDFAAAYTVPFLPWMLWGIERARAKAMLGLRGGWRMFAIALAMNLLAGFPETAYFNGLLALAWAILRGLQTASAERMSFLRRIAWGGIAGVALCAPQLLAFLEFLPHAFVGGHGGDMAHWSLPRAALLPSLVAPYAFGPPFALSIPGVPLPLVFGNIGGYVTLPVLLLAAYAVIARPSAYAWLLLAWSVLALGKTFGLEPCVWLWNLVPGVPQTAFYRYAQQTWEFGLIVLAAGAVDSLAGPVRLHRPAALAALLLALTALAASAKFYGESLLPQFSTSPGLPYVATAAAAWATLTTIAGLWLLIGSRAPWRPAALAVLLVVDGLVLYATPTLSNPRGGTIDEPAIRFLRVRLGLQRFYSLGPIQPNYSAYFGIGSINHVYLPVPQRWVEWVRAHLDSEANPTAFNGSMSRPGPTQAQELRRNFEAYESVGVRYVIAPAASNPFVDTLSSQSDRAGARPLLLQPGQAATGVLPATLVTQRAVVDGLGVLVGNGGNTANGMLALTLCSGTACASGSRSLTQSRDGGVFDIALDRPLEIAANVPIQYTFAYGDGRTPMALWAFPTKGQLQAQNLMGPDGPLEGFGLQIDLQLPSPLANRVKLAYSDDLMSIYELPNPKSYFEVSDGPCLLQAIERTRLVADCQAPATLIRRELFFPGWTAALNGKDATLQEHDGLFQAVALPPGRSEVRFRYAPPYIGWAWLSTLAALSVLIGASASGMRQRIDRYRRERKLRATVNDARPQLAD